MRMPSWLPTGCALLAVALIALSGVLCDEIESENESETNTLGRAASFQRTLRNSMSATGEDSSVDGEQQEAEGQGTGHQRKQAQLEDENENENGNEVENEMGNVNGKGEGNEAVDEGGKGKGNEAEDEGGKGNGKGKGSEDEDEEQNGLRRESEKEKLESRDQEGEKGILESRDEESEKGTSQEGQMTREGGRGEQTTTADTLAGTHVSVVELAHSGDLAEKGSSQFLSPSQSARRRRKHWWDSDKILTAVLIDAESDYSRNIRKRQALLPAGNPPWARDSPPPGAPPGPSPFTFLDRMFVATYSCPMETRLGAWGDGGKWICLSHYKSMNKEPVVLSVGSNGDTTFEEDVYRRFGVASYTLDFSLEPTVAAEVSSLEYIKLLSIGLAGSKERKEIRRKFLRKGKFKFHTIDEVLYLMEKKYVDIFKVDCELCEHGVVNDMGALYTRETVPFGQIQMEIHKCSDIARTSRLLSVLEDLGFRLFHVEINPYGAGFDNWQYEVSFIHESLVKPRFDQ